ncbi:MAG: NUDIX hydrolase [Fidelibacterota bacterium]
MKGNSLLNLLQVYQEQYPDEKHQVFRMISFLESNEDCFERTNRAGHFTGSAWIVNHSHDAVLLTHHRKLNKWLQLGGHADGNPNLVDVARAEAKEESGLKALTLVSTEIFDLDIHPIHHLERDLDHLHYDVRFFFEASSNAEIVVSVESHDVSWVPFENILKLNSELSMRRMLKKTKIAFGL